MTKSDDTSLPDAVALRKPQGDSESIGCDGVEYQGLFPRQPVANHSKGRLVFIFVLICYAIIDYGRLQYVPIGGDTGSYWHNFYACYTELYFHNDLAHWFPYGVYGQPNLAYSLTGITPTDYLMMAVGKVFHIKNGVLLFQLSLMADHLLLLFGIYLLARNLFRRRSAVWLCLIGSITLLNGLYLPSIFVLRMVSWHPLILYFLVRFFRDQRAEGLWMAGLVFTFSCLGRAYLQPHMAMGILPFVVAGTWKHPGAWRNVFRWRAGNLGMMLMFGASSLLYLCVASHVLDGIKSVSPGRDLSGLVELDEFVGIGDGMSGKLFEIVVSFFLGHDFYIGLLPFGCVLWGIFRTRTPLFAVFVATALLVAWLSIGGLLDVLLYYCVPFISFLHYLSLGFHLIPVLLLLAAGAAWDVFVPSRKDLTLWLALPAIIFFSIDLCFYADNFPMTTKNLHLFLSYCRWPFIKLAVYAALLGLAWLLSLLYRCSRRREEADRLGGAESPPPHVGGYRLSGLLSFQSLAVAALLAGLFVDAFQYSYWSGTPANPTIHSLRVEPGSWEPVNKTSPLYRASYVLPLTWQGERLDRPVDERKKVALQEPVYVDAYAFAQFDPCQTQLSERRAIGTAMQKLLSLRHKDDPALQTILGCHAPKLRLLTQALYVNTEAEAAAAVWSHRDLTNVAIIELPSYIPRPPLPRSPPAESPGSVAVTDFGANAIQIYVNVTVPGGAWLVYADTYDPRWRAWANGKRVPVFPAYVGLKAVWVPHGESVVRMKFSAWSNVGVRLLAVGGAICSLSLLLYCGICCVRGFPSSKRKLSATPPSRSDESVEPVLPVP